MVVAIPVGRRTSLVVAWTRAWGMRSVLWRAGCGDLPSPGDGGADGDGVREPRRPRPPVAGER